MAAAARLPTRPNNHALRPRMRPRKLEDTRPSMDSGRTGARGDSSWEVAARRFGASRAPEPPRDPSARRQGEPAQRFAVLTSMSMFSRSATSCIAARTRAMVTPRGASHCASDPEERRAGDGGFVGGRVERHDVEPEPVQRARYGADDAGVVDRVALHDAGDALRAAVLLGALGVARRHVEARGRLQLRSLARDRAISSAVPDTSIITPNSPPRTAIRLSSMLPPRSVT